MLANTEVVVKENALFANISKRNVSLPSNLNNGKVVANPVLLLFLANRDTGLFLCENSFSVQMFIYL